MRALLPSILLHEPLSHLLHVNVVEGLEIHVWLRRVPFAAVRLVQWATGALGKPLLIVQLL